MSEGDREVEGEALLDSSRPLGSQLSQSITVVSEETNKDGRGGEFLTVFFFFVAVDFDFDLVELINSVRSTLVSITLLTTIDRAASLLLLSAATCLFLLLFSVGVSPVGLGGARFIVAVLAGARPAGPPLAELNAGVEESMFFVLMI